MLFGFVTSFWGCIQFRRHFSGKKGIISVCKPNWEKENLILVYSWLLGNFGFEFFWVYLEEDESVLFSFRLNIRSSADFTLLKHDLWKIGHDVVSCASLGRHLALSGIPFDSRTDMTWCCVWL